VIDSELVDLEARVRQPVDEVANAVLTDMIV
jgi:hypothetical protein